MFDLITNLPVILGGAVALVLTLLGYGKVKERKGRKAGVQDVRRRAQVGAEQRKEGRNEIDDDIAARGADDARDSLRDDWAD